MKSFQVRLAALPVLIVLACLCAADSTEAWKAPARAARRKNPIAADERSLAEGKSFYEKECLACHGTLGKGDGPQAKDLEVKPGDLTVPAMWDQSDGELFWKVTEGKKPMPAYDKTHTEDQRWSVVNYIRTLAPRVPAPPALPSPQDKLFSAVIEAYLSVQQALTKEQADAAAQAAKGLVDAATVLAGSPTPALDGMTAEAWAAVTASIKSSSEKLSASADLGSLRAAFAPASDALVASLQKFSPSEALVHFRCPRALDGKGAAWVQKGELSENPYLAMEGCPCCQKCAEFVRR